MSRDLEEVADFAPAAKIELLDLSVMPYDAAADQAAEDDLSTRDYGAWGKLRKHFFRWGSLPKSPRALAKIAGIGLPSFKRAAPNLARHFDPDGDGGWTDHFLMRARGTRSVVPSPEAPACDPRLSELRRAAGAAGGHASVKKRRELAAQRQTPGSDESEADGLLQAEAKSQANGPTKPSEPASDLLPPAPGWLVGERDSDSGKTNQPTARVGEANGEANADGQSQAKPLADAERAPGSETRMIELIIRTCPGKVKPETADLGLRTLRKWIAEDGISFERDYLPALKAFTASGDVRSIVNSSIKDATFRSRDRRLATASYASPSDVFLLEGTPPWRAWLRFKGMTSHATRARDADRKIGWNFLSEWPQGWDAARLAEAEGTRHEVPATAPS